MSSAHPAYDQLVRRHQRAWRFEHLQSIAGWDRAACMPPKGAEARAAAMAEMAALLHGLRTDAALGAQLDDAQAEPLDDLQRANLREMRREWRRATALPERLVEERSLATARCEHAWRTQRPANDWAGFLDNFRPVLQLAREEAQRLSDTLGLAPYDALLDGYEPGMTSERVAAVFGELRTWLPGFIQQARERQASETVLPLQGPFAVAGQKAVSQKLMQRLGFDFDAGRLDESAHPFSGGVPEDVRLTTRYREDDLLPGLMGTVHETGHARYEQNLPREWLGQPVGAARSMALHESQSLSFEMQLGASRAFAELLAPLLAEHFGLQPAFDAGNLHRLLTRVQPGRIRVDADELTYPAHVILRFEIERPLIEGGLQADDIPERWNAGMRELLDLDTRGDFKDGPLQDVHWPDGLFGYFPCYTLGAMYAAQWFAGLRREQPGVDARIAAGDLQPVFGWLRERIWSQASRWPADELAVRASGEPLNPAHFKAHLAARYLA